MFSFSRLTAAYRFVCLKTHCTCCSRRQISSKFIKNGFRYSTRCLFASRSFNTKPVQLSDSYEFSCRPSCLDIHNNKAQFYAWHNVKRNFSVSSGSTSAENIMNVFDRNAKRMQRNITSALPDPETYDYIKEEVTSRFSCKWCQ